MKRPLTHQSGRFLVVKNVSGAIVFRDVMLDDAESQGTAFRAEMNVAMGTC